VPDLPEDIPQDPPTVIETLANAEANHGHKLTISEVVPRVEREAEREVEREGPQEKAQVNGDEEVYEIAQVNKDNARGYVGLAGPPNLQTPLRYSTLPGIVAMPSCNA
jgi:hypothetical protein